MAYQLSKSGSDWKTIKVKAIGSNGEPSDLPDVCEYVRFSGISWTRDGKGFFYSRCSASLLALCSPAFVLSAGLLTQGLLPCVL
jgi:prolyl oligopeptidase